MRTTFVTAAAESVEVFAVTMPVVVDPLDTVVTGRLPVTTWLTGLTDARTSAITVPLNHFVQLRISSAVTSKPSAHNMITPGRRKTGNDPAKIWLDAPACNWPAQLIVALCG